MPGLLYSRSGYHYSQRTGRYQYLWPIPFRVGKTVTLEATNVFNAVYTNDPVLNDLEGTFCLPPDSTLTGFTATIPVRTVGDPGSPTNHCHFHRTGLRCDPEPCCDAEHNRWMMAISTKQPVGAMALSIADAYPIGRQQTVALLLEVFKQIPCLDVVL